MEQDQNGESVYQFVFVDTAVIFTPSTSLIGIDDYIVTDYDDSNLFSIIDPENLKLYKFVLSSGELISQIDIETSGPNSIGPSDSGTSLVRVDGKTYIWSNVLSCFNEIDDTGLIINRFCLGDDTEYIYGVRPYFDFLRNPVQIGDGFLVSSVVLNPLSNDFTTVPVIQKYKFDSDSIIFLGNIAFLPKDYNIGFTGFAQFKYIPSVVLSEDEKSFFVSYPLSHDVFEYTLDGEPINSFTVRSKYIDDFVPLKNLNYRQQMFDREVLPPDAEEVNAYDLTNSDYNGIIRYGKSSLLLRIANIRPDIDDYSLGRTIPNFSVTIFNEEGQIYGERYFSGDIYDLFMAFSTSRGIYILNKQKSFQKDGQLVFDIFELQKSEK